MSVDNSLDLRLVNQPGLKLPCTGKGGVHGSQLDLPFKPFTRIEVEEVTQAPSALIDALWGTVLEERTGDVGFMPGLDWMQCFAVFVASRWLHEGSGLQRAVGAAVFVANLGHDVMQRELTQGRSFPASTPSGGTLVRAPDSRLGRTLNLATLQAEFRDRLDRVFSRRGVQV